MAEKIEIYANYGVLAHEYTPLYSYGGPMTETYDKLTAELPEGWQVVDGQAPDEKLIESPWGLTQGITESLIERGGDPWIVSCDEQGKQYLRKLKVVG